MLNSISETGVRFNYLLRFKSLDYLHKMGYNERLKLLLDLSELPSETNWRSIVEIFTTYKDCDEKYQALDIANDVLRHWPDELRILDSSIYSFVEGKAASHALICRKVWIYRKGSDGNKRLYEVAQSKNLRNLKILVLTRSDIRSNGLEAFLTSPYMKQIRELYFVNMSILDENWKTFSKSQPFYRLKKFRISKCLLTNLVELIQSPLLVNVTDLDLNQSYLGLDNRLKLLLTQPLINQIKTLNLSDNGMNDTHTHVFMQTRFTSLEQLNLSRSNLSEVMKTRLSKWAKEKKVTILF